MLNQLLTVDQVAKYLVVDSNTVYRWCRSGKLPGMKIGREWRVEQRDLESFLVGRKSGPAPISLDLIFSRQLTPPEHILVLLTEPEAVYGLEAEFFKVAVRKGQRLLKGCWWQHPDDVRQRLTDAGLPIAELEKQGKFVAYDFWEAYRQGGAESVLELWVRQSKAWEGQTFWGSGSHLLDEWKGNWEEFANYETELHEVLCRLPGVVLCPCVTTAAVAEGTLELLNLIPHHSGALFLPKDNPVLMRIAV